MKPENPEVRRSHHTTAVILAAVLVVFACGLVAVVGLMNPTPTDQQIAAIHARNPAFNLEKSTPKANAAALEATQEAQLSGYGWVDKQNGIAKIPIDRAMELIVQAAQTESAQ